MRHEIRLTGFTINPNESIQVDYEWNNVGASVIYLNDANMLELNSDILQNNEDVARWLMYYMVQLGHNSSTMPTMIGRMLVVDMGPAVQQTIALV